MNNEEQKDYNGGYDMMMRIDEEMDAAFDEAIAYAIGDTKESDIKDVDGVMRDIKMDFTDHMDFTDSGYSDAAIAGIFDGFDAAFKFRWDEYFMKSEVREYMEYKIAEINESYKDFQAYEWKEAIEEVKAMAKKDKDYIEVIEIFEEHAKGIKRYK